MWLLAKRTATILITILSFGVAGALLYGTRRVLITFLFSIFFAYLLEPWVLRLQHWRPVSRGSRGIAILEVYLLMGIVITVLLLLVGPGMMDQGRKLGEALPGLLEKVSSGRIAREIGANHGWSANTQLYLEHLLANHSSIVLSWGGEIAAYVAVFVRNLVWLLLIPIFSIFLLKDGARFATHMVTILERKRQRQFVRAILDDLDEMLAHFIRAQLLLTSLSLVVYMGGLWLLRVPYGLALGAIAGFMEFVPVVGPLVGAVAIFGLAFLADYQHLLVVVIFLGVWRVMQDYVTSPRIMGQKLEIHPLAAILAVLAGAEVAGVLGVYLSVPLMASVRILWRRWQTYETAPSRSADLMATSPTSASSR